MAEEFQNRFKHTFPKNISSQDVTFQYDIIPVQNAKDKTTPYTDGELLNFIISRNSNEWVDMRACRLEYDLSLYQETTETSLNADLFNQYYTFSAGVPFISAYETVNESTIIMNFNSDFSRFCAARAMCSSKPILIESSNVEGATVGGKTYSYNLKKNPQWTIEEYSTAGFSDISDRVFNGTHIVSSPSGAELRKSSMHMSVPLQMVSALASANDYVPIGFLSQNSNIGYRLSLAIKAASQNVTLLLPNPNILTTTLQHRIYNPRLVCKYVTIKNQSLQNELSKMFNKIPQEIEGQVYTPTIKINFNNFISNPSKIIKANSQSASLRYNISERSLKGMVMRFVSDSLYNAIYVDKNLSDTAVILSTLQVSVGSRTIPLQPLSIGYDDGVFASQEVYYSEARHLFDPNNTYSRTGAISRFYNHRDLFDDPVKSALAGNQNAYFISFENMGQNAFETEQTDHSRGLDTWLEGNYISVDMTFLNALVEDVKVDIAFVKQSTLLISNGQNELIENKINLEPTAPIV